MLSIIDLIERKTLDIPRAAYLAWRIQDKASFITGAVPGGAGKTTVMGALLNLLPSETEIVPCENLSVIQEVGQREDPVCALAHEISHGFYYCYIWDETLRAFFSLSHKDHILATNLHADDLEQAHNQICVQNGVPQEDFNAVDLFIFLRISGGFMSRAITVSEILTFDEGKGSHTPVTPQLINEAPIKKWTTLFQELLDNNVRTIEEVREHVV
jgi:type IV secretory pathway ATPase VirB11/archaellum biosynthesis ATPase